MCNGDKILPELVKLKTQPRNLACTVDDNCWCTQVTTKFSHVLDLEDCMSPQEMLDQASVVLPDHDVKYLKKLANRTFVRYGEDE